MNTKHKQKPRAGSPVLAGSGAGRLVGLETTLHVFRSEGRYRAAKARLSRKGTITEIFVDNRHAFELKLWRKPT